MSTELEQYQEQIIGLCAKLNNKGMLAAGDGNVSIKLADGSLLVTARGKNKSFLTQGDFARISPMGEVVEGDPSTELKLHRQVYENCPQARAVIHAHPPHLIAYSIVHPHAKELPTEALPEVVLGIGSIPIAPYGRPGTDDLAQSVAQILQQGSRALIMARHGALAWGENLLEAYNGLERMEHAAQILAAASAFGVPKSMDKAEVHYLRSQHAARGRSSL